MMAVVTGRHRRKAGRSTTAPAMLSVIRLGDCQAYAGSDIFATLGSMM